MPWLSENSLFEALGTRALFLASYGAADFGECRQAVQRVGDGGVDDWHREWTATADWLVQQGDDSAGRGHPVSAREAYLRASNYYRTAYTPLFGSPVDPRLKAAFEREEETFAKAAPLWDIRVELVEIPIEEGITLPGVFVGTGEGSWSRGTIVHVNGYDSNVHEMFAAHVPAALSRGYNILLFDGPEQGRNLIRNGLTIRPDWENVVRPVLEYALARREVDESRIILAGWSFGGFLAPGRPGSSTGSRRCGRIRVSGTSGRSCWAGRRSPTRRRRRFRTALIRTRWTRWNGACGRPMQIRSCAGASCNAGRGYTARRPCSITLPTPCGSSSRRWRATSSAPRW